MKSPWLSHEYLRQRDLWATRPARRAALSLTLGTSMMSVVMADSPNGLKNHVKEQSVVRFTARTLCPSALPSRVPRPLGRTGEPRVNYSTSRSRARCAPSDRLLGLGQLKNEVFCCVLEVVIRVLAAVLIDPR